MKHKTYLGDGVYAAVDQIGRVVMTTENGIYATNTIVLEPEVLRNFESWLDGVRKLAAAARLEPEIPAVEPQSDTDTGFSTAPGDDAGKG